MFYIDLGIFKNYLQLIFFLIKNYYYALIHV